MPARCSGSLLVPLGYMRRVGRMSVLSQALFRKFSTRYRPCEEDSAFSLTKSRRVRTCPVAYAVEVSYQGLKAAEFFLAATAIPFCQENS